MEKVWGLRSEFRSEELGLRSFMSTLSSTLLEEEEGNSVRNTPQLHSTQLSPASLNDGPRTQRKGHCREWVRGRHGPQAYPDTILKSLLSGCLHRVSISL